MYTTGLLAATDNVASPLIVDTVTDTLEQTVEDALVDLIEFLPGLIAALIILGIGYLIGKRLEPFVARLVSRLDVDDKLRGTQVGEMIRNDAQQRTDGGANANPDPRPQNQRQPAGQTPAPQYGAVATATGLVVKYYVILFAAFLAADRLGIAGLGVWLERLIDYAPEFLAGVGIIILGLVFADYAARRTRNSELSQESGYGTWITALVRGLLYAIVLIIGLEMVGFDLEFVYIIADGVASTIGVGLTFAIAVAIGIVGGLFLKDYYEEHLRDRVTDE